jgi:hypothetical protein
VIPREGVERALFRDHSVQVIHVIPREGVESLRVPPAHIVARQVIPREGVESRLRADLDLEVVV